LAEADIDGLNEKRGSQHPGNRAQENIISSEKREHSRKPDEQYDLIEACSFGERLELFARGPRPGWTVWGNQSENYEPTWNTYANHSQAKVLPFLKKA
jgi:N6-adenosine-specific RNA methylase IME4